MESITHCRLGKRCEPREILGVWRHTGGGNSRARRIAGRRRHGALRGRGGSRCAARVLRRAGARNGAATGRRCAAGSRAYGYGYAYGNGGSNGSGAGASGVTWRGARSARSGCEPAVRCR